MSALGSGLPQPDQRSCGPAAMVVARAQADPSFADGLAGRFAVEVLAAHRRLTRRRLHGRLQVPWPRALGTPPWALARELTALTGTRHRAHLVRWSHDVEPGPGALYVGDRWLPRHVLLVLGGDPPRCYNPAGGRVLPLDSPTLTSWRTRWFVVTPTGRRTRA